MSRPAQPLAFREPAETVTVPLVLDKVAAEALLDFARRSEYGSFTLNFQAGLLMLCDKRLSMKQR